MHLDSYFFTGKFNQVFKQKSKETNKYQSYTNSQKTEEKESLPNLFDEVIITPILNL